MLHVVLSKQPINQLILVQQRRQLVLRANFPITYIYCHMIGTEGEMSSGSINNLSQCTAGGVIFFFSKSLNKTILDFSLFQSSFLKEMELSHKLRENCACGRWMNFKKFGTVLMKSFSTLRI